MKNHELEWHLHWKTPALALDVKSEGLYRQVSRLQPLTGLRFANPWAIRGNASHGP